MGKKMSGGDGHLREQAEASSLSRRDFLLASAGAGAGLYVLGLGGLGAGGVATAEPLDLDIFTQGYPRAFFGRHVEGDVRSGQLTYEEFEKKYRPLDGIVGKVLNEENYYTGKDNLPFFRQFKAQNPRKMVLLHYNGTGRRATDEVTTKFFPGHFLHYKGTKLTQGIKNRAQTVLHVADTSVFRAKRYRTSAGEDIAIARIGSNGKPSWATAEQVRLERINTRDKTITVRRGNYNTRTSTFPTGSYLAAHVTTGPYRYEDTPQNNIPLWAYNFSTMCPRDADGRNCGDALVDYLWKKLRTAPEPEGELSSFDGIIFDVFSWVLRFGNPIDQIDVNTDGKADRGIFNDVNTVSKGALDFMRKLREKLPQKILMSDGHLPIESQRSFGYLNGVESEGYADKYDITLDHLSRGENIFGYWKQNSQSPPLNYMNFRYKQLRPKANRNTFAEPNLTEDRSYRKLRLALASAHFTDSAFTASGGDLEAGGDGWLPPEVNWTPPGETTPVRVRVFDEIWKGQDQERHWLGQPMPGERGKPIHRAALAPDIFDGQGNGEGGGWDTSLVQSFQGTGVSFSGSGTPTMTITNTTPSRPREMSFRRPNIVVPGNDLFVSLRLKAEPLESFQASVPRRVTVGVTTPGGTVNPTDEEFTWAGRDAFTASLYFQDVGPGTVDLKFEVEGQQKVYFEKLTVHSATNGRHREYEGGIVLANPSMRSYTFNLGSIFRTLLRDDRVTLRRLNGFDSQHPAYETTKVNNGSVVAQPPPPGEEPPLHPLTLPAKDALFLVKEQP